MVGSSDPAPRVPFNLAEEIRASRRQNSTDAISELPLEAPGARRMNGVINSQALLRPWRKFIPRSWQVL